MSLDNLNSRAKRLLGQIRASAPRDQHSLVVIYNPETGKPCPGYEAAAVLLLSPDDGRGGVWLPEKYRLER